MFYTNTCSPVELRLRSREEALEAHPEGQSPALEPHQAASPASGRACVLSRPPQELPGAHPRPVAIGAPDSDPLVPVADLEPAALAFARDDPAFDRDGL